MEIGGAYLISGLTIAGVDPGSPALGLGITRGSDLVVRRADDPSNSAYGVYLATGTYDGLSLDVPQGQAGSFGIYAAGGSRLSNVTVNIGGASNAGIVAIVHVPIESE